MHSRSKDSSDVNNILWGTAVFFVVTLMILALIWYEYKIHINYYLMFLSWHTLDCVLVINEFLAKWGQRIPDFIIPHSIQDDAIKIQNEINRSNSGQLSIHSANNMLGLISYPLRILLLPVYAYFFYLFLKFTRATRRYRHFTTDALAYIMIERFPNIAPAIIANLLKLDPDTGPYRRELGPIKWSIVNDCITAYNVHERKENVLNTVYTPLIEGFEHVPNNSQETMVLQNIFKKDKDLSYKRNKSLTKIHKLCKFDMERAESVFRMQMGDYFTSPEKMSIPRRCMFAVFASYAVGDKEQAFALLKQFNVSWNLTYKKLIKNDFSGVKINTDKVDEVISKLIDKDEIQSVIEKHAYEVTVLKRLLEVARNKGKLFPSLWYWVKAVDRNLWYTLHQTGGKTSWTEASGPKAHYLAEVKVGRPIYKPVCYEAAFALKVYLDETEGWLMPEKAILALEEGEKVTLKELKS